MKLKRFISLLAIGVCALGLCACGATETNQTSSKSNTESKPAVLVVSFGTSYNDTREATIGAVEKKIEEKFPDYDVRRAFTSQTIIDKLKERDNIEIDNVDTAMQKLVDDNVKELIVQPTHVMNGFEYEEMLNAVKPYEDKFTKLSIGQPLLTSDEDYNKVVEALAAETPQLSDNGTAVIFVGHGTEHYANATYAALDYRFKALGYKNAFIGTVEGYPDLEKVKAGVNALGVNKAVLAPLMIVAGDHATNDICGEEEGSWATEFKKEGYSVECLKKGLGEYEGIRELFAEHVQQAADEGQEEE